MHPFVSGTIPQAEVPQYAIGDVAVVIKYAVAAGNLYTGFKFFGTFDSSEDAKAWGERNPDEVGHSWGVIRLDAWKEVV